MKFKVDHNYVWWKCPGCGHKHGLPIKDASHLGNSQASWEWNGSVEKPTLTPSVNIVSDSCHFFIKEGNVEFCSDSKHKLAGRTVEIPEFE